MIELPIDLIERIISLVEDIDIRRYFGVYNKIDITKYKFLEKIFPTKIYYNWCCLDTCPENCDIHEVPKNFNPVLTPIIKNVSTNIASRWIIENHKLKLINRNNKTKGHYKCYKIRYELPNHIEGDYRKYQGGGADIMEIEIYVYDKCVTYDLGIWKIKKKTGQKELENKNMYNMGNLDTNIYYTDYLEWSYDLE